MNAFDREVNLVMQALSQLDSTPESRVSLMAGLPLSEIEALGGLGRSRMPQELTRAEAAAGSAWVRAVVTRTPMKPVRFHRMMRKRLGQVEINWPLAQTPYMHANPEDVACGLLWSVLMKRVRVAYYEALAKADERHQARCANTTEPAAFDRDESYRRAIIEAMTQVRWFDVYPPHARFSVHFGADRVTGFME